jgi:hypothetical protein
VAQFRSGDARREASRTPSVPSLANHRLCPEPSEVNCMRVPRLCLPLLLVAAVQKPQKWTRRSTCLHTRHTAGIIQQKKFFSRFIHQHVACQLVGFCVVQFNWNVLHQTYYCDLITMRGFIVNYIFNGSTVDITYNNDFVNLKSSQSRYDTSMHL